MSGLPDGLRRLEAEAIFILREVAASFRNPVLLYSIGKDSSVLLRLAQKAFFPSRIPFPLLHIDTTWKFREMIAFRDRTAAELGLDLRVHVNEDGLARGISPVTSGQATLHPRHEDRGAAPGTRQMEVRCRHRRRPARRGEKQGEGAHLLASLGGARLGPAQPAARAVEPVQHAACAGRVDARLSAVELDRARRVGIHPGGGHSDRSALSCAAAAGGRACRHIARRRRRSPAAAAGRADAPGAGAGFGRSAAIRCPAQSVPRPRRSTRSSARSAADACRSGRGDSSIATTAPRWKRRSARAISDAASVAPADLWLGR